MDSIVEAIVQTFSSSASRELIIFLVSMMPILRAARRHFSGEFIGGRLAKGDDHLFCWNNPADPIYLVVYPPDLGMAEKYALCQVGTPD
ncbi:hypothetical protein [Anaeromassilibacillus sp. SJQ-1]|uniref:hypothetical protein n=1 Tax=Anaeromassilibacillus sp. SJQ-1 TaxID=3375419 RepID=UPI00398A1CB3